MLRLNRLTDYAVVLMVHLARSDAVITAHELARRTRIPQPTVAKLLVVLAKAGLAGAHRGASGGYVLSRGPESISVAHVMEAIEGPASLTACVDGAHSCDLEHICVLHGHWDRVNAAIRRALEGISLKDIADSEIEIRACAPQLIGDGLGALVTAPLAAEDNR